jgi:hypothetical protein
VNNNEICERKWSWTNLGHYPGIYLAKTRKTTKKKPVKIVSVLAKTSSRHPQIQVKNVTT